MQSGCDVFDFSLLMSSESFPPKCVFMYMWVCVGGLFAVSVMNMRLVLAVTLEPQTSVRACVCMNPCVCVSDRVVRGGLRLFQAKRVT